MAIDAPLNTGVARSFGSVVHTNLVTQQPDGTFVFSSDPGNLSSMSVDNLSYRAKIASGEVSGVTRVVKFGAGSVGTTLVPISGAATYQTPITAENLEIVSDNTGDSAGGAGARTVTIIGLGSDYREVSQDVVTNGTTPVALSTPLTRLHRWIVSSSGSYANETTGSHIGNLTVQGLGGGVVWDVIENSPFPSGQSHIGAYSIPIGKTGFLVDKSISVDTNKSVNVYFFNRDHIDDVTVPYSGVMRLIDRDFGLTGMYSTKYPIFKGPFVGPTDIGGLAQVSVATAEVSISFTLLLLDT